MSPTSLLVSLNELTIVRRIEVEKRPTRCKVLNESLADGVGGSGKSTGITNPATIVPTIGTALSTLAAPMPLVVGIIDPARLAINALPYFGECHAVDLRKTTKHLDLESADGKGVDNRHRDKSMASLCSGYGRRRFLYHSGSFSASLGWAHLRWIVTNFSAELRGRGRRGGGGEGTGAVLILSEIIWPHTPSLLPNAVLLADCLKAYQGRLDDLTMTRI